MKLALERIFSHATRISEIYGTLIALGLVLYFFIAYLFGFLHIIELRGLNLFIMLAGIYYALRQYERTHPGKIDYFRALLLGITTAFIGTSTFVLFLFLYLKADSSLMQSIREAGPMGPYLNEYITTFAVWFEGIFSGLILTFILINFLADQKE